MSYTVIDGKRVYGKKFAYGSFGPTDISFEVYENNSKILSEAYYTKQWLDKKYNMDFPDITFKLSDLYKIDIDTLIEISRCIGIKYHKRRKTTVPEKKALCRSIKKIISQGPI
jgi:hypothetical protein